ncbi:Hypothetical protein, putative [Bodo saltans]|uniref:Uncharacterized protein n=1 Tax=Bodo saltans TaxID=75058 RepID=A0A0S4JLE3_BODSA|nr:Hypothetical protein, putative [Bodo saltans]|eukprot:CUG92322.1 Hypothetical protein, putative [Bodo saltans]
MIHTFEERNRALASMPSRDALSMFMSKFQPPTGSTDASTSLSNSKLSSTQEYQYSPLDGYSRVTKDSAALRHSQVPTTSMRVLPLPPDDGSRPYQQPSSPDAIKTTKVYKRGDFLATSSEVYGWQQQKDDCKPQQWHGRKRYDDVPAEKKEASTKSAWHGRRKWKDGEAA